MFALLCSSSFARTYSGKMGLFRFHEGSDSHSALMHKPADTALFNPYSQVNFMPAFSFSRHSCHRKYFNVSYIILFLCLLSGLIIGYAPNSEAQGKPPFSNRELKAMAIPAGVEPPKLDGDLSDPAWKFASKADNFINPENNNPALDQTEAYLLYDKNAIYVAFYCHDSKPEQIVARETVRDSQMFNDDTVRIILDPFLNRKYEDYNFLTINARGTRQTEFAGGRAGKVEWQGDWEAISKIVKDGWITEIRIPWEILPYPRKTGAFNMGFNLRRDQQRTKLSSFYSNRGPSGQSQYDGTWQGVLPPAKAWKPRLSTLPYILPQIQEGGGHSQIRFGLDSRYQPTPELTAVGTISPDFQSVEGAVESIAFSRSERFVRDKRPFFQEGRNDIGLGEGYQIGLLFNTARIKKVDTGLKLYGKLDPKTTIGTLATVGFGSEANFVGNIRRDLSSTSSANFFAEQHLERGKDNSVFAFATNQRKGKWSIDGQLAQTLGTEAGGTAWTGAVNIDDKNLFSTLRYRNVGRTFKDRLGFIEFNDYQGLSNYNEGGAPWRKKGTFRNYSFSGGFNWDWKQDGTPFRRAGNLNLSFETKNDYSIGFGIYGGKFEESTDTIYNVSFGGSVSNRFKSWGVQFSTGTQADRPYTSVGPMINLRVFKKLDISVGSFIQNYEGVSQQTIVTMNYEINPFQSWGGRVVVQDNDTNFYVSYHNSGRKGTDSYFILGDPNARRFVKRLTLKFVFSI